MFRPGVNISKLVPPSSDPPLKLICDLLVTTKRALCSAGIRFTSHLVHHRWLLWAVTRTNRYPRCVPASCLLAQLPHTELVRAFPLIQPRPGRWRCGPAWRPLTRVCLVSLRLLVMWWIVGLPVLKQEDSMLIVTFVIYRWGVERGFCCHGNSLRSCRGDFRH